MSRAGSTAAGPSGAVAFGPSSAALAAVVRARSGARRRALVVGSVLVVLVLAVAAVSLSVGDFVVPLPDVLRSLAGRGDPADSFVVTGLRLPRVATAVVVGLALGTSGAAFQQVLRNPLATPDVLGVSQGASAAAVACIVLLGLSGTPVALAALGGALATAVVVQLLAWHRGLSAYRLVLVGIAVAAVLASVTSWVLTRAPLQSAAEALVWLTGSLNDARWAAFVPLAVAVAVLVPLVVALGHPLRALQLGDDAAHGLGAPVDRSRAGLLVAAVVLVAVATAAAGPVPFVALAAGPVAVRLVGGPGPTLLPSALVGALLVLVSDLVAQHVLSGVQLPVGVVTGAVGAPYLMWLLASGDRRGRGA